MRCIILPIENSRRPGVAIRPIAEIPAYSSSEGFKIYPDHAYQIEASYTNETDHDVDAMAVMDLFYHPQDNLDITYE